jgi:hypothetical protein
MTQLKLAKAISAMAAGQQPELAALKKSWNRTSSPKRRQAM